MWRFLIKLVIDLPQDAATPLIGIYPKDVPPYHKDTCSIRFIIARKEQPRHPSIDELIKKMWYIYEWSST